MKRCHLFACLIFLLCLLCLPSTAQAVDASLTHFQTQRTDTARFQDISAADWFADSVQTAYAMGLMNGQSVERFAPGDNVTLAETVTMAARLHSIYHTGAEHFAPFDVHWYDPYTTYASQQGIWTAPAEGMDRAATRAQFALILSGAFDEQALTPINALDGFSIPDVSATADSSAAIYRLYRAGILTGTGTGHAFSPNATITRAQAAAVLTRMADPALRIQIDFSAVSPNAAVSPAQQALQLINEVRRQNGLPALLLDEHVQAAAQRRAQEIASDFSHIRPDGASCFSALDEQGISYRSAGENIAAGQRTAEEAVTAWMNSPGHRDHILSAEFTITGIGYYEADDSYGRYWTQLFAG